MKHLSRSGRPHLRALAVSAAQLALPFLLSAARLSGGYAPFSLALVAVAGPRLPGLLSLAGAGAGSLLFMDFQAGLRHFAVAILLYAANMAFYDTKLYRRPLFRPCLGAGMMLLVQSIYLLHRSFEQWVFCFFSAAVLACAVWCWHSLWKKPDKPGVMLLLAALSTAAQPVALLDAVSLGRVTAAALALWMVWEFPFSTAVSAAAAVGLLMDLEPVAPRLLLTAVYGCAAAAASVLRRPRSMSALAFSLTAALSAVLFRADVPPAILCESSAAAMAMFPVCRRYSPAPPDTPAVPAPVEPPALRRSAAALRELYESYFRVIPPAPPENPSVLFDRAAEQVCRGCVLCGSCWHQNYNSTYNAFNDACPKLLRRGRAEASDFPLYFSSRCVHFSDFITALNAELRVFLVRRQYRQRLLDTRRQAQTQYQQLGEALASSAVYAVSNVTVPDIAAPIGYQIGSGMRPKEGERLCGDQLASFEVGSTLYLLLSDGMGSGESAHREAAMTVRLLQQFLKAGVDPDPALRTLNTALRLRGESGGSFTTIDLLAFRRDNGTAAVYKYGAAPSYIKRTGTVTRIVGQSLPAGLQDEPPEITRVSLQAGSFFVMISDGIADETNDEWLQNLLAGWQGQEVNALVSLIFSESRSRKGLNDDCAVLILQIPDPGRNGKKQV